MALQIVGLVVAIYIVTSLNVRYILRFLMLFVRSERIVIWLLSVIFLPGTFIHELSHLLSAELLLVPTSDLHIIPELLPDRTVKLGSVRMAQTDRIRRFLIGTAPLLVGTLILWISTYVVATMFVDSPIAWSVHIYILFQVSHSMFSSRKDLEGAVWGILGIVLIAVLVRFIGQIVEIPALNRLVSESGKALGAYMPYLSKGLLDTLLLDGVLLFSLWITVRVVSAIKKR